MVGGSSMIGFPLVIAVSGWNIPGIKPGLVYILGQADDELLVAKDKYICKISLSISR